MGLFTNNPDNKKSQYSSSYTSENISDENISYSQEYPTYYSVGLHRPNTVFASIERLKRVCAENTPLFEQARTSFNEQNSQYQTTVSSHTIESAREQVEAARINNDTQQKDKSEVFIDKEGNFSGDTFDEGALIVPPEWTHKPVVSSDQYDQNKWDLAA